MMLAEMVDSDVAVVIAPKEKRNVIIMQRNKTVVKDNTFEGLGDQIKPSKFLYRYRFWGN